MSKKRVSADKNSPGDWLSRSLKRHGFIGVALSGGKNDKKCLAFVEYYPEHKKIFLSELVDRMRGEGDVSADLILHEHILRTRVKTELIAFNVALSFPKCVECRLKCPGYESCKVEEIQ